jgi:hypothetical protein
MHTALTINSVILTNVLLSNFQWDYLFAVVAAFALIGALIALLRGIYHSSAKYIAIAILTLVLILAMQPLVSLVGSIDVSQFGSFSIPVKDEQVKVGVIDNTLVEVIEKMGLVSSASQASLDQAALALAHSILGLAIFFVGFLLIIILLGPLLGELLFALTFGIFMNRDKMKSHPHRLPSFFVGAVCGAVIGCLFLSPFTSIANLLTGSAQEVQKEEDDGTVDKNNMGDYQAYIDLLASYQNSAYFSTMRLGSSDASAAIDTKLMDQVTAMTVNGVTTSLTSETNALVGLVPYIASSLKITGTQVALDYTTLLKPDNIKGLLNQLTSSKLLVGLLPALVEMAGNLAKVDQYGIHIDYNSIGTNTIDDLNNIYAQLYDAGLIDDYVIPNLTGNSSSAPTAFQIKFSKKDNYKSAVKTVISDKTVSSSLPSIAVALAKISAKNKLDFISTIESRYAELTSDGKLTDDLVNIVEFLFDVCRGLGITALDQTTINELGTKIVDKMQNDSAFLANLTALVCGCSDGRKIYFAADGENEEYTNDTFPGLLGLNIISGNIVDIKTATTWSLSQISGIDQYLSSADISRLGAKMASLVSDTSSLKKEMSYFLAAVPDIKKLTDQSSNLDITTDENIATIKNVLKTVKKSTVLPEVLPSFIRSALKTADLSSMLYGLSVDDFDFDPKDSSGNSILIDQISSLLDVVAQANDLSKVLTEKGAGGGDPTAQEVLTRFDSAKQDELKSVLTSLLSNKVINPDKRIDGTSKVQSNGNFNALVEGLLQSDSLSSVGLVLTSDLSSIDWLGNGTAANPGEISRLTSVVSVMNKYASFFAQGSDIKMSSLSKDMIKEIFTVIGQSQLLSASLPSILNTSVAPLISKLGITVNFNAVTDWAKEGEYFGEVVRLLNSLGTDVNLETIDWANMSAKHINALLTALSQTGMLSVQKDDSGLYVDKFGQLAYTMISKAGLSEDMTGDSLNQDAFSCLTNRYTGDYDAEFWAKSITSSSYTITLTSGGVSQDVSITDAKLDTAGEISRISAIFQTIQDVGLTNITDGKATGTQLETMLKAVSASKTFGPALPYLMKYAIRNIDDIVVDSESTISFKTTANPMYLKTLLDAGDTTEVSKEIHTICSLYDQFKDSALVTKLTGDPTTLTEAELGQLEDLLDDVASMKVFTTVAEGQEYSFFTHLVAVIIHSSTVDQMITKASQADAENLMLPLISSIPSASWIFDQTTLTTSALRIAEGKSLNGSEILKITRILRIVVSEGGSISLDDLTSPQGMSASQINDILQALNTSRILHYALPEFFSKVFTSMKIIDFLTIEGVQYRYLNTDTHLDYEQANLDWWSNEITEMTELFGKLKALSGSDEIDFSKIKIGAAGQSLYTYVGCLDKMHIFDDSKEYIVFKFLNQNAGGRNVTDYLRSFSSASEWATNSDKAYMIRRLLFRDGHSDSWLQTQCEILDNFILKMTDMIKLGTAEFTSGTNTTAQAAAFGLIMSTMKTASNGTYTRCLLASELMSGFLSAQFTDVKASLEALFFGATTDDPDYLYLNIIEARGLEGILKLQNLPTYDKTNPTPFNTMLEDIFALLGRTYPSGETSFISGTAVQGSHQESVSEAALDLTVSETVTAYNSMLTLAEAKASLTRYVAQDDATVKLNNSRMGILLFDSYAAKANAVSSGGKTYTVKEVITDYNKAIDKAKAATDPLVLANSVVQTLRSADKIDYYNKSFEANATAFETATALVSDGSLAAAITLLG